MPELDDVRDLLDGRRGGPGVQKDDIEQAVQGLLAHQIVYNDTPGFRRELFDLVRRHSGFFDRYFSAMGHRLIIDPGTSMIALAPGTTRYGWRLSRLKKDETLVMIALRLGLDDGLKAGQMDELGRVETNTDDLHDQIKTLSGGAEPPRLETRLLEILKDIRRRGGVLVGEPDKTERITPLIILPGMTILVDDAFVTGVVRWLESGAHGDVFEALADQEAEKEAAAMESAHAESLESTDDEVQGVPA